MLVDQGKKFEEAEDHAAAHNVWTTLVEQFPDFAEGWNLRAKSHFVARNYESCVGDADRAIELQPRHFSAWAGRALAQMHLGSYAAAIASFERATCININPGLYTASITRHIVFCLDQLAAPEPQLPDPEEKIYFEQPKEEEDLDSEQAPLNPPQTDPSPLRFV